MAISLPQDNMIRNQVHTWEVADHAILNLMASVPRDRFVDPEYVGVACIDTHVKAMNGATMLPSPEVGRMLVRLDVQATDSVAIVGAESGYLVALLAHRAHHITWFLPKVYHAKTPTIEGVTLVDFSQETPFWQDGPFDVIVIAGAVETCPDYWQDGLSRSGRMWVVQGESAKCQTAWLIGHHSAQSHYETSWPWLDGFAPEERFIF